MATQPDTHNLTMALDEAAREAKLLQRARGSFLAWTDMPWLVLVATNLYFVARAPDGISTATLALVMALAC